MKPSWRWTRKSWRPSKNHSRVCRFAGFTLFSIDMNFAPYPIDRTQVFHDQIVAKQRELQPWTLKINKKRADIDIATSERDTLTKKAEELQAGMEEAEGTLRQLQGDQQVKVGTFICLQTQMFKRFSLPIGSRTRQPTQAKSQPAESSPSRRAQARGCSSPGFAIPNQSKFFETKG